MDRYSKCPYCKNPKTGLNIYRCDNCKRLACYYDGIWGAGATGCWYNHDHCPTCKRTHTMRKVGEVW